MAYSNIDDLLLELSEQELINLTRGTDEPDESVASRAIEFADALINAYLAGTYKLPLAEPIDELIKKISVDLAIVYLAENYFAYSSLPGVLVWKKIYAIKNCKDLQAGFLKLPNHAMDSSFTKYVSSNKTADNRIYNSNILDLLLEF
jgi:hypothetical protein